MCDVGLGGFIDTCPTYDDATYCLDECINHSDCVGIGVESIFDVARFRQAISAYDKDSNQRQQQQSTTTINDQRHPTTTTIHQRPPTYANDHQRPPTTNDHQRSPTTTTANDHQRPPTTTNDHQRPTTNDHNDQRPQQPTTTTTTTTEERQSNSVRKPAEVPIPRLQCLNAHGVLHSAAPSCQRGSLKLGLSIDRYTRNWIATKSFDRVPGKAQDRDCCAEGEPNSWTVLRCHLLLGVAKSIKQLTSESDHPASVQVIAQVIAQVIVRPLQILIFRPLPLQLLIWSTPTVRTSKRSSPTA